MENILFDKQLAVVASAFLARNEDNESSPILKAIFERHDMSGAIALAAVNGGIEIKGDEIRGWVTDTFQALNAIFEFDLDELQELPQDEAEPEDQSE
jgi:hypothetical protein